MSDTVGNSLSEDTSGYTGDMDGELNSASPINVQSGFSDISEFYVSAMGHTRLFTAKRYGKQYILKGLKPDYLYTPVYRQALTKEFEIGLQLDHPNICRTLSLENIPGCGTVIVMEHIDGDTLKELLETRKLTAEMARKAASQVVDALDYMHSKQIIHRDLKPSNIMLTHNGRNVKIIDFSLSDSDIFTVLKLPAGTSGYIAPELYQADAKSTAESDIYSFGVVLREMAAATGDHELSRIAKNCTRRNPSQRPANKAEIFAPAHTTLRQRLLVAGLAVASLLFAAYICATLYSRNAGASGNDDIEDTLYIGNTVKDFG